MMHARRNPTKYRKARETFAEMLPGDRRDKSAIIRYLNDFDVEWDTINVQISPVWLISYLRDAVTEEMLRNGQTPKPSDTMTHQALEACAAISWEDAEHNNIDQAYPTSVGVELSLALLGSPMAIEMLSKDHPMLYKAIRRLRGKALAMLEEHLHGFSQNDLRALFSVLRGLGIEYVHPARGSGPNESLTFDEATKHIARLIGHEKRGRDAYTVSAKRFALKYGLDDSTMYTPHSGLMLSMALAGSEKAQRDLLTFGKKKVADALRHHLGLPYALPNRSERVQKPPRRLRQERHEGIDLGPAGPRH